MPQGVSSVAAPRASYARPVGGGKLETPQSASHPRVVCTRGRPVSARRTAARSHDRVDAGATELSGVNACDIASYTRVVAARARGCCARRTVHTVPMRDICYRGASAYLPGHRPGDCVIVGPDGRIVWTGNASEAPATDVTVDLGDALLAPAFVDAHVHATSTGLALDGLDLGSTRSLAEALDRVAAHAAAHPGSIVLGSGWDETTWPEHRAPTGEELDRAAPCRAVYLARADVHSAVVSAALVDRAPQLRTERGYDGSGHVRLDAHHTARAVAHAAITPAQRHTAQRRTRAEAGRLGIGSLHEMCGPEVSGEADLTALLELAAAEAGPGVIGYWAALGDVATAVRLGVGAAGDLFCDGAIGSHTAALTEPYADRPDLAGYLYHDVAALAAHVVACTLAGVQAGFHAIGDRALTAVAEGFLAAAAEVGVDAVRAQRHRIEHAEMPSVDVVEIMSRLAIIASVQPAFDAAWGGERGMYVERLGARRGVALNPLADYVAAGVPLALGSDAPVTPLDPWGGIRAAVRHRTPSSSIPYPAAFRAATVGGWQAARIDGCGELRAGAPATFACWALDEQLDADGLPDIDAPTPRCVLTVVDGATVFDAAISR